MLIYVSFVICNVWSNLFFNLCFQGDIATCAGTWLHLWSINGDELACVNTSVGRADRMQQILCVAFSQCREWDPQNVIMTGSTDGVVRVQFIRDLFLKTYCAFDIFKYYFILINILFILFPFNLCISYTLS